QRAAGSSTSVCVKRETTASKDASSNGTAVASASTSASATAPARSCAMRSCPAELRQRPDVDAAAAPEVEAPARTAPEQLRERLPHERRHRGGVLRQVAVVPVRHLVVAGHGQ